MKSALGNVLGTFISAMTGIKVEVEPNPAGLFVVSSKSSLETLEAYRKD
jgi:hypothetical protein